jgi:hypothetical protein
LVGDDLKKERGLRPIADGLRPMTENGWRMAEKAPSADSGSLITVSGLKTTNTKMSEYKDFEDMEVWQVRGLLLKAEMLKC